MNGEVRKDGEQIPKLLLTDFVAARSCKSSVVPGMIEKLDNQNVRRGAKRQRGDTKTVADQHCGCTVFQEFGSAGHDRKT